MVARVLLLMRAGLSPPPRPPVRLSRAPLDTRTSSFKSIEKTSDTESQTHSSSNQRPNQHDLY